MTPIKVSKKLNDETVFSNLQDKKRKNRPKIK